MAYRFVVNPAQTPNKKETNTMQKKRTRTPRRKPKATQSRAATTPPKRRRRRNPITALAANPARRRRRRNFSINFGGSRRRRFRRNPAGGGVANILGAALVSAIGFKFVQAVLQRLPVPGGSAGRVGAQLGAAYMVHKFGKKVVSQGTADTVAIVIAALAVSDGLDWLAPDLFGFKWLPSLNLTSTTTVDAAATPVADVYQIGPGSWPMGDVYLTT